MILLNSRVGVRLAGRGGIPKSKHSVPVKGENIYLESPMRAWGWALGESEELGRGSAIEHYPVCMSPRVLSWKIQKENGEKEEEKRQ